MRVGQWVYPQDLWGRLFGRIRVGTTHGWKFGIRVGSSLGPVSQPEISNQGWFKGRAYNRHHG